MSVKDTGIKIDTKKKFDPSSLTIIIIALALFIFLSATKGNTFLSFNNIHSILYGVSINFFGAIGFTLLIIMGELDLSIGSVFAFSGMMAGMLMKSGAELFPAVVLSLTLCGLIGLANGFMVVKFKVSSMMVTLGSMTAVRGLADLLCSNLYGYDYPQKYQAIAKVRVGEGQQAVYLTIILMVVMVIVLEILLKRTSIFKKMYFVGENIETAKIYGIRSGMIKIIVFVVSSVVSGIGGLLTGARLGFAETTIGLGLEFTVLTAVVLGGASLSGGKGSILRSCVGLIFLSMISSGMIIYNINPLIQQFVVGVILIVAVFIDTRVRIAGDKGVSKAQSSHKKEAVQ